MIAIEFRRPDRRRRELPSIRSVHAVVFKISEIASALYFFDRNGNQRLALDVSPSDLGEVGVPGLDMRDGRGAATVVATAVGDRGSLNLADGANLDTALRFQIDDKGPIFRRPTSTRNLDSCIRGDLRGEWCGYTITVKLGF